MEDLKNIEKLLDDVAIILRKHDQIDQSTGRCFNIFNITDIAHKELEICRVIHELIDPKGSHYQKGKYLKLFFENVLKIEDFTPNVEECNNAIVNREYSIEGDRRIDLFIEIDDKKIPIEVKIEAKDQPLQCYDYCMYARNYDKGAKDKMFYLTLYGTNPSPESLGDLNLENDVKCISFNDVKRISFKNEILKWISECLKDRETIKLSPVREILLQFDAVVRDLTGTLEEDKAMEITKLLMESSSNVRSAVELEKGDVIRKTKEKMLEKVLKALEKKLTKRYGAKINNQYDYEKLINTFFNTKELSYPAPGITFRLMEDKMKKYELCLRVEVDGPVCFGICSMNNNYEEENEINAEIKNSIKIDTSNAGGWWLHWEFLPNGGTKGKNATEVSPNFKNPNDAFCDLFDDAKFNPFIKKCVKQIEKFMESIEQSKI